MFYEAKKRYRLSILNFIVSSNHIHLIVFADNGKDSIPKAMQLSAGRSGQAYNRRIGRKRTEANTIPWMLEDSIEF